MSDNPITASRQDIVRLEMSTAQAREIQMRLLRTFNYDPGNPTGFKDGLETPGGVAWLMDAFYEVL